MLEFIVTPSGIEGLPNRVSRAILELTQEIRHTVLSAARYYSQAAKRHAPEGHYFDESGTRVHPTALRHKPHTKLKDSIRPGAETAITLAAGRGQPVWGYEVPVVMAAHGKFTRGGVRPHMIFPRREKGALAFFWEGLPEGAVLAEKVRVINRTGTGGFVLTFHVHHPGFPPNRWDLKAWFEVKDRIWQMMKEAGYDFVVAVGGKR